ncbi:hypothetical protein EOM39_04725 [Candidatus Gracilibacteria bacterium]|nr:hypothetical protein [Candidatus Gracilibacteria bacterium]
MFPFFEIFSVRIYTFGFSITLMFFLFYRMLQKLSKKFNYDFDIFKANILWFFISTFIFSRLFYVLSQWNDMKFIKKPFEFFIMSDYNFSLYGAIFGFFLVLLINLKIKKESIIKYLDGVVLAFTFVLVLGYIGSLLGGQIYGKPTNLGIEIKYDNSSSLVPYTVPIFPLPIIYSILSFGIFSSLYILKMYIKTKGFIGYLGLSAFACVTLIFEFFSGKDDIFSVNFFLNFNQICSLILIGFVGRILYNMVKMASFEGTLNIFEKE